MNARSRTGILYAMIAGVALVGLSGSARAEDMAGMKMEKGKNQGMGETGPAKMGPDKSASDAGKPSGAMAKKASDKFDIAITDKGFEPNSVDVKKGQPVELVFTRQTDQTCIKEVVLDTGAKKIKKALPLNTPVAIKTKFTKAGELKYACGMNMYTGTVKVQ